MHGMRIANAGQLTAHGNRRGRRDMAAILEAGLQAADPYWNTRRLVRVEDGRLLVGCAEFEPDGSVPTGEEVYDLSKLGRIFVFGAGKGLQRVAKALEDVLGDRLAGGHVIDKKGHPVILERIGVTLGGHPVPDEDCVRGCEEILALTRDLTEDDLVFTCVGNGVSSTLTMPVPGVSLDDVKRMTHIMQIEKGAPTPDLNPVRNHLDMMKGGRISRHICPAQAIHIISIDPGSFEELMHRNFWLHTLPDCTTYEDAVCNLKKWGAWDEVPAAVRDFLFAADPAYETVKWDEFQKMTFRVFGVMPGPRQTAKIPAAMRKAEELGYSAHFMAEEMSAIEARHAAAYISEIARTIESRGEPFRAPCAMFSSGEMVVTVGKNGGVGGRNQEFALAAAQRIAGSRRIVVGSVDTDGTDGPGGQFTEDHVEIPCLAGGIVDGMTLDEARSAGIDIESCLQRHDTTSALWRLGSGILAEPNISLNDLTVALIMQPDEDKETADA
jgi:glycerate 2-kinase